MHGWTDPADPSRRPAAPVRGRPPGRHRLRRRPGLLPLTAAVVVLLGLLGGVAATLPPVLSRTAERAAGDRDRVTGADGTGQVAAPSVPAAPAATRSATPVPVPGTPSPSPSTASPTRRPSPAQTRTPSRSPSGDDRAGQVVTLVNEARAAGGCGPVRINSRLTSAAQAHSADQATHDTMSHTGSDGSSPWDRARRAGYTKAIGENVAAGYRTPEAVMDGWMNSPGHRANILNCQARAIGVGVAAAGDGTPYWTQMFGLAL